MATEKDTQIFNSKYKVLFEELNKVFEEIKTKNLFTAILIGMNEDGTPLPTKQEIIVKSKDIGSYNFDTVMMKIRINLYQVEGEPLQFSIDTLSKNYSKEDGAMELKKITEYSIPFEDYTEADYTALKTGDVLDKICSQMMMKIIDSGMTPHQFIPVTEEHLEYDKKWITEYNAKKLAEEESNPYGPSKPTNNEMDEIQPNNISRDFSSWLNPETLKNIKPDDYNDNLDDNLDPDTLPRPK
jgi:hypothetical protein